MPFVLLSEEYKPFKLHSSQSCRSKHQPINPNRPCLKRSSAMSEITARAAQVSPLGWTTLIEPSPTLAWPTPFQSSTSIPTSTSNIPTTFITIPTTQPTSLSTSVIYDLTNNNENYIILGNLSNYTSTTPTFDCSAQHEQLNAAAATAARQAKITCWTTFSLQLVMSLSFLSTRVWKVYKNMKRARREKRQDDEEKPTHPQVTGKPSSTSSSSTAGGEWQQVTTTTCLNSLRDLASKTLRLLEQAQLQHNIDTIKERLTTLEVARGKDGEQRREEFNRLLQHMKNPPPQQANPQLQARPDFRPVWGGVLVSEHRPPPPLHQHRQHGSHANIAADPSPQQPATLQRIISLLEDLSGNVRSEYQNFHQTLDGNMKGIKLNQDAIRQDLDDLREAQQECNSAVLEMRDLWTQRRTSKNEMIVRQGAILSSESLPPPCERPPARERAGYGSRESRLLKVPDGQAIGSEPNKF